MEFESFQKLHVALPIYTNLYYGNVLQVPTPSPNSPSILSRERTSELNVM